MKATMLKGSCSGIWRTISPIFWDCVIGDLCVTAASIGGEIIPISFIEDCDKTVTSAHLCGQPHNDPMSSQPPERVMTLVLTRIVLLQFKLTL